MDENLAYLPIFFSLFLTCAVCGYAWRRRLAPDARAFIQLTLLEAFWLIGYLLELVSPSLRAKLFWDDFQFFGSMFIPYFLLVFAYEYTGNGHLLSLRVKRILIALSLLFMFLLYTNPLHGWVRNSNAWIIPGKPFDVLLYDFTPLMWVSFTYTYLASLVAIIVFIWNLKRINRLFQMQSWIIIAGFTLPTLGSIPGMFGVLLFGQRDLVPYTFGIANLFFAWGLFRLGLFRIAPIARAAVFEYMSDIVMVLDAGSRVIDINPSALTQFGKSAPQILGQSVSKLTMGQPSLFALFNSVEAVRRDVFHDDLNGVRHVLDAYLSPLEDQSGKLIGRLFVARDITFQSQMEEKLRKSNEELETRVHERTFELEQANRELEQKNAELERFTYTVSHDLKSPLVTINGYLGYIQRHIEKGDSVRLQNDIKRITDAVNRMNKLLNDLLQLSRVGRETNPLEWIGFEELVSEALALVHGQFEAGKISAQVQSDLPEVLCDRLRLVEVLQNLLENAGRFMGTQPDPLVIIGSTQDDSGSTVFYVKDNGIGIAPQYQEQIFGLFNRLDPNVDGTGVGLTLVKRIIEVHGGRVWVESQLGQGAAFCFTLNSDSTP